MFSYAYGKHETGFKEGNPIYEITAAFPDLNDFYFSLIGGAEQKIPIAIFSLLAGVYSAKLNRKYFLSVTSILWSIAILFNSQAESINDLQLYMIAFGSFSAVLNPVALSMIRDYFPPNQRSQANAWFSTVIYWGGAFASLSNFATCQFGWRNTYIGSGAIGIALGIFGIAFLENPIEGKYDPPIEAAPLLENPEMDDRLESLVA